MRARLLGLSGLFIGISTAWAAAAVEESLRPQLRPGAGLNPSETVVATAVPVRSLRPQIRPDTPPAPRASADPGFDRWVAAFRGRALSQGISAAVFDRAFKSARYNPDIVANDRNQSEFRREIWDYLDSAVSPARVENGRAALRRHLGTLNRIETRYGVEKEIVAAIWGMESNYGDRLGDLPLIGSMATLAYDGRRGAFFEKQLVTALKIVQAGDISPENMTGSWAGAMGHTQFMPTSYAAYAVDFTGDGKRDVWSDDPTDALASTAAYLDRFGWHENMPWGVEVRVPQGAAFGDTKRMPSDWASRGVVGTDGRAVRDHGSARILQPAGPSGPAFMVFANFDVIKRYNNSDAYALGVGHLADRIAGGGPLRASFPPDRYGLTKDDRIALQRGLTRRGFDAGDADGVIGSRTTAAIEAFQRARGLAVTGTPSQALLRAL